MKIQWASVNFFFSFHLFPLKGPDFLTFWRISAIMLFSPCQAIALGLFIRGIQIADSHADFWVGPVVNTKRMFQLYRCVPGFLQLTLFYLIVWFYISTSSLAHCSHLPVFRFSSTSLLPISGFPCLICTVLYIFLSFLLSRSCEFRTLNYF